MDHVVARDESNLGGWILILGCPWNDTHVLYDPVHQVTGPSFAVCANCPHQAGLDYEELDGEVDWSLQVYPERLKCNRMLGAEGIPA